MQKKNNIKLYIINIEPRIARNEFAPERHLMERVTALTGGKYYNVGDSLELHEIYSDIDQIEKSEIPVDALSRSQQPQLFERVSFYGFFVLMGILSLFISIFLDATILEEDSLICRPAFRIFKWNVFIRFSAAYSLLGLVVIQFSK